MHNQSNAFLATLAGLCSSGLVLLGMVTCCGMPLLAGILATVGIGASQLSFLAKYQGMFMGIAIVSLMFGFYQAYGVKKLSCCGSATPEPRESSCCCATETPASDVAAPPSRFLQFQKVFLWIGAAIVLSVIVFSGGNASAPVSDAPCCPISDPPVVMEIGVESDDLHVSAEKFVHPLLIFWFVP